MLDSDGFRPNVGIMICDHFGKLLWTKRACQNAWQFPQGGMQPGESFEEALYRELYEEVGLCAADVSILKRTRGWLRYRLPERLIRRVPGPPCIGQKQKWFLLSLDSDESRIELGRSMAPEFDDWRWIDYWEPAKRVVQFKRAVYRKALAEFRGARDKYVNGRAGEKQRPRAARASPVNWAETGKARS